MTGGADGRARWGSVDPLGGPSNAASEELVHGNQWLIGLRWLAAVGIVLLALFARDILGFPIPTHILVGLGLGVAAYNAVLLLVLTRITRADSTPGKHLVLLANAQIALDLVTLVAVIHFAGGASNPLCIYFVFHTIIASILLSRAAAYAQAAWAFVLYAAVVLGEGAGVLPHVQLPGAGPPGLDAGTMAQLAALGSALAISVFLTSTIASKLRKREADLAAALAEVGRQAAARDLAYDKLQQTQEMQLRYMHRISHELRAPLSAIAMMLRVVLRGLTGPVPEKQRDIVARAESRTETALDMVTDLLTLSSIRDAPLQEDAGEVAVGDLVRAVADSVAETVGERALQLTAEIPPSLPTIIGQADGLRTMLLNLVRNAVKYTPDGGSVMVAVRAENNDIVIDVSDTGIGIAPEDTDRIFDEFYRTPAARDTGIHGTGLGLAIVASVVQAHHGLITVSSELGKGTTFEVRLPTTGPPATDGAVP